MCSRELPRGTIRERWSRPTQESHCGAGSVFKTPAGGKERRDNVLFYIATNNMRQLKITKSITNRESASLDKYLQEIGKEDLITVEEEVELA